MPSSTTISVLNQKGGSGKTTLSLHLAHALTLKGFRVLLVDAEISQRVGFAESLNIGSTVLETAPMSAAASEVQAVVDEILQAMES